MIKESEIRFHTNPQKGHHHISGKIEGFEDVVFSTVMKILRIIAGLDFYYYGYLMFFYVL